MAAPQPSRLELVSLFDAKERARVTALERRAGCDSTMGIRLTGHVLEAGLIAPERAVSGFWPLPGEIDIRPLLLTLVGRGHPVGLPMTPRRGEKLSFYRWWPGAQLHAGRFGTSHPEGPELVPEVLLVPLLAFDRTGRRLGYGAGYYDRTLAALPGVPTIGCAFAAQEVAEVPAGSGDVSLDAVATECGVTAGKAR
jgi:5-formyltetrahydrofolate cyclo-ligase